MSALLASVKSLAEARLAAAGGCDWIDLKEPSNGALGAVSAQVISDVLDWAREQGIRQPVSATIGDCWKNPEQFPGRTDQAVALGVEYVKIGLPAHDVTRTVLRYVAESVAIGANVIVVCFAESAPRATDIERLAACGIRGVMLDTCDKNGHHLLDWMGDDDIAEFVRIARDRQLLCGLAGSLRRHHVDELIRHEPDYLGFRGALCDGDRGSDLSRVKVAEIRAEIDGAKASPMRMAAP